MLICTDVAARGLDLPNVDTVLHYQVPRSTALFVHRSGRTARGQRCGTAICFCSPKELKDWTRFLSRIGAFRASLKGVYHGIITRTLERYKNLIFWLSVCVGRDVEVLTKPEIIESITSQEVSLLRERFTVAVDVERQYHQVRRLSIVLDEMVFYCVFT